MSYLDKLKQLEGEKNHDIPPNPTCQNCQNPLLDSFGSFGSTDTGLYAKNLSANDSQPKAESVVVEIASKPNARPDRQIWKPDRCNRCVHIARFTGGNACLTDNGLRWLYGFSYEVPDDHGTICASWQANREETLHPTDWLH